METAARRKLPLHLVDDTERLRPVDPAWAEGLSQLMRADGQQTPILVQAEAARDNTHRLIAGGHRLAAARLLGWEEIDAELVACSDDEAQLLEIDENLMRRGLTVLEEGVFLAQRKAVYERLHPETKHGGDRVSDQMANLATRSLRFTAATAQDLDKSERTLRRRIALAEALAESGADLVQMLLTTPHADDQVGLSLLAGLPKSDRPKAVRFLTAAKNPALSLAAAVDRARGVTQPELDPDELQFAALMNHWRKAGAVARKRFRAFLAEKADA